MSLALYRKKSAEGGLEPAPGITTQAHALSATGHFAYCFCTQLATYTTTWIDVCPKKKYYEPFMIISIYHKRKMSQCSIILLNRCSCQKSKISMGNKRKSGDNQVAKRNRKFYNSGVKIKTTTSGSAGTNRRYR